MRFRYDSTVDKELNDISEKLMLNYLSIGSERRDNISMNKLIPGIGSLFERNEVRDMVVDEDRNHESHSNKIDVGKSGKMISVGEMSSHNVNYHRSNSLPPAKNSRLCSNVGYKGEGLNLINKCSRRLNSRTRRDEYRNNKETENNKITDETENKTNKNNLGYKMYSISAIDIVNSTEAYTKLFVNIILVFTTLYIIFGVIFVIKNDIESKIQISTTNIIEEMSLCSKQYIDNKCQPDLRVPAMESKCNEWERCMSQNPTIIARKSIFTAQIIGEILNTFFDQISFKSALFIFGFIIALIVGNFFIIEASLSGANKNKKAGNNSNNNENSCEIVTNNKKVL
ncbi:hypothetical protein RS030_1128 [Cryptosporidium xiaoi]|uniref:Brl1/Brr6 domain-containing protein n=1 Tax=Cryptosporidium xiaoi TaxID=659607 RepID=A0AAV9Y1N0_9CRYT